ncbi:type II toxin-antitoxin system RelE/ParE family toxin [Zhouia sp. PK063]|uniref:type II toxin-antitoxin system RelE/ParE family toxin n=1 Tax=Zhouia sp. PK063 TaxID=3373602 RepID=UPI00379A3713
MSLTHYKLTQEADNDLDQIFDYTEVEFGFDQAVRYLTEIRMLFDKLVVTPNLGRSRNELRSHTFSITHQKHIIFYSIEPDSILIIRILHSSRDLPKFLK